MYPQRVRQGAGMAQLATLPKPRRRHAHPGCQPRRSRRRRHAGRLRQGSTGHKTGEAFAPASSAAACMSQETAGDAGVASKACHSIAGELAEGDLAIGW